MTRYANVLAALITVSAICASACSDGDPVVDNKQNKVLQELDIEVDGSDTFVKKGSQRTMKAIAKYADDSKVDVSADPGTTWTTSNAAEATVDKGLVTTLTEGTVTIKATYNGKSADETITITP